MWLFINSLGNPGSDSLESTASTIKTFAYARDVWLPYWLLFALRVQFLSLHVYQISHNEHLYYQNKPQIKVPQKKQERDSAMSRHECQRNKIECDKDPTPLRNSIRWPFTIFDRCPVALLNKKLSVAPKSSATLSSDSSRNEDTWGRNDHNCESIKLFQAGHLRFVYFFRAQGFKYVLEEHWT